MSENHRGPLAWFASNHVASNLLMIFILVSGAFSIWTIKVETFPEVQADTVTIQVPYLGASPAEVEEGVCQRVEEAIASVEGIKQIRSTAVEGLGTVIAELQEDADSRRVLDEVKAAVDRIITFPVETEKPIVSESISRRKVISLVVYGDASERALKTLGEEIRDDLTAIDGITQVDMAGVRNYEISIEVSEEDLRRHGLSFVQVADAVRQSSLDLPGGSVKTEGGEVLIRTKGQRYRGEEFEELVLLSRADGSRVLLGDVATVVDGFEDSDTAARFDGYPAALVDVYRVGEEDTLEIAESVHGYVEEKRPFLPEGIRVESWQDDSVILRSRLNLLVRNGFLGLILVFLCLALFLDLRLAFWTTMGIPISFMGALWLMPYFGVSINMISLFAFIVSLGIVVDDAIVVGENVYSYLQEGMPPLEAAISGVREMARPVSFAIFTTVAAFAPLLFTAGRMGKFMRQIPSVVILVLLISLVEALLILPAHLSARSHRETTGRIRRIQDRFRNALQRFIQGTYSRHLGVALRWRYLSLAVALAAFVVTLGFVAGGHIQFNFMPRIDADNMVAALTMPQGTPRETTEAVLRKLEGDAETVRQEFETRIGDGEPSLYQHVSTTVGEQPYARRGAHGGGPQMGSNANVGEVNVQLLSSEERGVGSMALANRWREVAGEIPGVSTLTFASALFTAGDAVNVEMAHRDFDTLLLAVERLKAILAEYPGVKDISDSFLTGKREIRLELTPEGRAMGFTLADLARQARQGFYGEEAQRIQRGRDDVRVMVRYPEGERQSLEDIRSMRIRLPDGTEVPFATVATVREGRGYAAINRTDRRRVVSVTADVEEEIANADTINQDLEDLVIPQLQAEFPGLLGTFEGQERERSESMASLGRNFLIAQLVIFALLAILFRSYVQPLIVMSAIPFGIIGAVAGHLLLGLDLSLLSFFGIVALTGVVVNDSLIMIDLINRERSAGVPIREVIMNSGKRRFRPILLTTLTTFFGLTPMILERSLQAKFLIPMAVSLGFGVLFATGITLILVPVLYAILEDVKTGWRRFKREKLGMTPQEPGIEEATE